MTYEELTELVAGYNIGCRRMLESGTVLPRVISIVAENMFINEETGPLVDVVRHQLKALQKCGIFDVTKDKA